MKICSLVVLLCLVSGMATAEKTTRKLMMRRHKKYMMYAKAGKVSYSKGAKGYDAKSSPSKGGKGYYSKAAHRPVASVQLGPRPFWLVDEMNDSFLKEELEHCAANIKHYEVHDFSIAHRGACLQFPEHTLESYKAAAVQGAGIIECDVTFTKDRELVCRHAQCDLHTTTDVVLRPEMNAKCTTPWAPGVSPRCCTTDFTLEEIKMLCAKMDSSGGADAETAEEYVYGGTADWRTDIHQYECHEVPTHIESIELIQQWDAKFTPELKGPEVEMPYEGDYTQEDYAQQMIDEYIYMGVDPEYVWPQSFNPEDVYYWVQNTDYGKQAVALDDVYDRNEEEVEAWIKELYENHVNIVAPPLWRLVEPDLSTKLGIVPSHYALTAQKYGLDIITWTLERTDPGLNGWYWQTLQDDLDLREGDRYSLLYVLAFEVEVLGVFSDWPATTTFFANCLL